METFLSLLFFLGIIVVVVGAILFFIDYAQKRNKKKSLIIIGVGIIMGIVSLGGISLIDQHNAAIAEAQQQKIAKLKKEKNKKFKDTASEYLAEYYIIFGKAEDLGNTINKSWGDSIENSSADYDVDKVLDAIEAKNSSKITTITDGQSQLDTYLATLKKNDTGKYNLKTYETANDRMSTLTTMVTSISGSYSSFGTDFSDADDAVSKSFKAISSTY
ncbi:hypothetical protein [Lactiplantibacillus plantarum]|uniref:hypothetical protein n=1 Tax=Lactiplantibacillus plantarum TaxID=1590 RepID=UPI0021A5566B|nr:hypothetical protein [Lactiplantibacillus plantarum]MCT4452832.1 hypothetical protein [Lactiplantibacillus plantarum]MCT4460360.1 hypothetical protein [Lactiplantibacillus plantarum]